MSSCKTCHRERNPLLKVQAIVKTTVMRQIEARMKEGLCWFCAAGMAPMNTARGGNPEKEVKRTV